VSIGLLKVFSNKSHAITNGCMGRLVFVDVTVAAGGTMTTAPTAVFFLQQPQQQQHNPISNAKKPMPPAITRYLRSPMDFHQRTKPKRKYIGDSIVDKHTN
jgi:hypothetical protein